MLFVADIKIKSRQKISSIDLVIFLRQHIPFSTTNSVSLKHEVKMKQDLCESLYVDDGDQSKEERKPVLNSGHVGQQAALRQNLHHCEGNMALKLKLSSGTGTAL